jgi:serine/threonine protein kinase
MGCASSSHLKAQVEFASAASLAHSNAPSFEKQADSAVSLPITRGYKYLQELGRGAFASVWLASHPTRGLVAMKEISALTAGEKVMAENEINVLLSLSHPGAVRLVEHFYIGDSVVLVEEFCDGGDLQQRVVAPGRRPSEAKLREWVGGLLRTLQHMHANGIVHRDVKPANRKGGGCFDLTGAVFVSSDGRVRLGDFGMAAMRGVGHRHVTLAGSPFYMAPEMINEEGYGSGVDIWAVGCTVLALCISAEERRARRFSKIVALLSEGDRLEFVNFLLVKGFSNAVVDFVQSCLTLDAAKRPTAAQLLRYPFFHASSPSLEDLTSLV